MTKKASDLFEAINMINDKKEREFDLSKVNAYILSLWIAQDKNLIKFANKLNPYIFSIDNGVAFRYYYSIVPKGRRFIKWTKKKKTENTEKIDELCLKYNISPKEAKLSIKGE